MINGASRADDSFDPTYAPSTSEYSAQFPRGRGAITWNPEDGTVKLTGRTTLETEGEAGRGHMRLSHTREGAITLGQNRNERDGVTQFSVESQFAVSTRAGIEGAGRLAGAELEGAVQSGVRSRYRVYLPDAVAPDSGERTPATAAQVAGVNPFDPTTLPIGGRVTLDSQSFNQRELQMAFRNIATMNQVTEAQGTSIAVTRLDEHHVRMVTGPNQAIEALQGVGIDTGVARAMAGRQDLLGQSSLQTADFDLRQPDAQAAYMRMMATGQVADQTPGVSNVARVDRLDFSSQQRLQLGLANDTLTADIAGRRNTGTEIRTTQPNGDLTITQQLRYDDNVQLTISRSYARDGENYRENVGDRNYQFRVDTDVPTPGWVDRTLGGRNEATEERNIATNLNEAMTGSRDGPGQIRPGEAVTVSFNEAQMQDFMRRTHAVVDRVPGGPDPLATIARDGNDQPQHDSAAFAVAMARNLGGNANGFAERLLRVANDGDPTGPIRPIDAQLARDDGTLLANPAPAQRQAPVEPVTPARAAVDDPRDPAHRDHALYNQSFQAAQRLPPDQGGAPEQSAERMAMAGTIAARQAGLTQVDHLVVGHRGQAFVVQGPLESPAHLRAGFDHQAALNTPVEDSRRQLQTVPEQNVAQAPQMGHDQDVQVRSAGARSV